jgi:hypothetical protein
MLTVPDQIQPVPQEGPPVWALLLFDAPRNRVEETRRNLQNFDVSHDASIHTDRTPVLPHVTPTFILRHEDAGRISEFTVKHLEISEHTDDKWDTILHSALTPSAYQRLTGNFVLRLWRNTRWIIQRVRWKTGGSAAARAVNSPAGRQVKRGPTEWVRSGR